MKKLLFSLIILIMLSNVAYGQVWNASSVGQDCSGTGVTSGNGCTDAIDGIFNNAANYWYYNNPYPTPFYLDIGRDACIGRVRLNARDGDLNRGTKDFWVEYSTDDITYLNFSTTDTIASVPAYTDIYEYNFTDNSDNYEPQIARYFKFYSTANFEASNLIMMTEISIDEDITNSICVSPPPTNSTWNYTNENIIEGEDSTTWNTGGTINASSNAVSFTFSTDINANSSCSPYPSNYTTMVANYPEGKLTTTETTSHALTAYHWNLSYGVNYVYCALISEEGVESANYSAKLQIDYYDTPNITLISPTDDSTDIDGLINFTYKPIWYYGDVTSCSLYGNWSNQDTWNEHLVNATGGFLNRVKSNDSDWNTYANQEDTDAYLYMGTYLNNLTNATFNIKTGGYGNAGHDGTYYIVCQNTSLFEGPSILNMVALHNVSEDNNDYYLNLSLPNICINASDGLVKVGMWRNQGGAKYYESTLSYVNGSTYQEFGLNQTNISVIINDSNNWFNEINISNGDYKWNVECTNEKGLSNWSSSDYTFKVDIPTDNPPTITLNSPADNNWTYYYNQMVQGTKFNATIEDDFKVENISLYLNGVLNDTYLIVADTNITTTTWNKILSRGTWIWNAYGCDNSSQCSFGTNRALYINNSIPTWINNISNTTLNRASGTTLYLQNLSSYVQDLDEDTVTFSVQDETTTEVDCTILGNNLSFTTYGYWYGNASCIIGIQDSYGDNGENRTIGIEVLAVDLDKPVITLINPLNNARTTGTYTELRYNVTDYSTISNCSLYVNKTLNQTDTSITKNIPQSFFVNTGESKSYSWNVSCLDYYNNTNVTNERVFRVNTPPSIPDLNNPSNASYVGGSTTLLDWNSSTDNESDSITYYIWYEDANPPGYSSYTSNTQEYVDTSSTGTYYWYLKAYDGYEFSQSSKQYYFTTSLDAPVLSKISPTLTLTDDSSILFNVSVIDDNLDTTNTKLNLGGTWYYLNDYSSSGDTYYFDRTITGLTEQNYSYYFTALNNEGVLGTTGINYIMVNYSAYIDIAYTAGIGPYGSIHWKPSTGYNITYAEPDGMSATNYTFSVKNDDTTRNGTVLVRVDTEETGYDMCCNDGYDNTTCTGINTTYNSVNATLKAGQTCNVWCWINYTNPVEIWNFNLYVNLKGV